MTTILWRSERLASTELCELREIPGGHRLAGIVLTAVERRPIRIGYQVDADEGWRTRAVEITRFQGGDVRSLALECDADGRWTVDAIPAPELEGCSDVDLEWTPATNTLPIRRARLSPDGIPAGGPFLVAAAWVRFPGLSVERLDQTYEALGPSRWRYASGSFSAGLEVDADGLVLDYEGLWRAIGHSDPGSLERSRG